MFSITVEICVTTPQSAVVVLLHSHQNRFADNKIVALNQLNAKHRIQSVLFFSSKGLYGLSGFPNMPYKGLYVLPRFPNMPYKGLYGLPEFPNMPSKPLATLPEVLGSRPRPWTACLNFWETKKGLGQLAEVLGQVGQGLG